MIESTNLDKMSSMTFVLIF